MPYKYIEPDSGMETGAERKVKITMQATLLALGCLTRVQQLAAWHGHMAASLQAGCARCKRYISLMAVLWLCLAAYS